MNNILSGFMYSLHFILLTSPRYYREKKTHILKLSIFNITEVEVEKVETGSCI